MAYRTDNPHADFAAYMYQQEKALAKRPCCGICGEHIGDDYAYNIDGEWFHQDCYNEAFLKALD